jgi:hypothetical protein
VRGFRGRGGVEPAEVQGEKMGGEEAEAQRLTALLGHDRWGLGQGEIKGRQCFKEERMREMKKFDDSFEEVS